MHNNSKRSVDTPKIFRILKICLHYSHQEITKICFLMGTIIWLKRRNKFPEYCQATLFFIGYMFKENGRLISVVTTSLVTSSDRLLL